MNRNGRSSRPKRSLLFLRVTMALLLVSLAVDAVVCDDDHHHQVAKVTAVAPASNPVGSGVASSRSFFDYIFGAWRTSTGRSGNGVAAGRTFGGKRVQFMLMPMVYKMGVMMTMLTVLTIISLKGLTVGVILLILKLSAIFGKLYTSFGGGGGGYGHSPAPGWTPPQPVHVHLHNSGQLAHAQPAYSGWEPGPLPPDESYHYKG